MSADPTDPRDDSSPSIAAGEQRSAPTSDQSDLSPISPTPKKGEESSQEKSSLDETVENSAEESTEESSEEPTEEPALLPVEHVFRWDLDKTYLQTEFERVRDMVKTALQKPEEKQTVPGAIPLLKSLLEHHGEGHRRTVYFVSGSPRQMRKVLERKFELDGIHPEAFVLKPNLENILKLRFRAIRGQVGYKLRALLEHQLQSSEPVPETLFGDDAEQDAIIYSIYAEILAGRIRGEELERILEIAGVYSHNAKAIMESAESIEPAERVQRIFIHLDQKSPLEHFRPYAPRLVAVFNYFQAALVLFQDGLLDVQDIIRISLHMIENDGYNTASLANSFQGLLRRGVLRAESVELLVEQLREKVSVEGGPREIMDEFAERLKGIEGFEVPPYEAETPPDYTALLKATLKKES